MLPAPGNTTRLGTQVPAAGEKTEVETSTWMRPATELGSVEEESLRKSTAEVQDEAKPLHSTPNVTEHVEDAHSQQGMGTVEEGASAEVVEDLLCHTGRRTACQMSENQK